MSRRIPVTLSFAALVIALLTAAPARADLHHITWVASNGDASVTNDCSRKTPCATFQQALTKTAAGGEIRVLDQGSFGVLNIDKSISIVGDGVAGIMGLTPGTEIALTAISITAGANDVINLRGLVIEGAGIGKSGIMFLSGGALHIQNSVIRGFRGFPDGNGIMFVPIGSSELYVTDTLIADNGGNLLSTTGVRSGGGIMIFPTNAASAKVVLDRVRVENNLVGIKIFNNASATGTTLVTMRDSISAGNLNEGIYMQGPASTQVMIDRSAVVNNAGNGISSNGGELHTTLSNSLVSGNMGTGVLISDYGTLDYTRNNIIVGNWPLGPPGREQNIDGDQCVASLTRIC